jgi:sugar (pentulose or hexulose) kinase
MVQSFLTASKRLLKKHHEQCRRGLCGLLFHQGEGTVPVDEHGQPLSNCILWMDMRGAANLEETAFKEWLNIDGAAAQKVLRFIQLTGGMPSMTGKDPSATCCTFAMRCRTSTKEPTAS